MIKLDGSSFFMLCAHLQGRLDLEFNDAIHAMVQYHFIIPHIHINNSMPTREMLSLMPRDCLSHLIKCQEI